MLIISKKCHKLLNYATKYNYSLHFLHGNDSRKLTIPQQHQVLQIIQRNNFKTSSLLYNTNQVQNKIKSWKDKLPWIQPYYAIKSNPCTPILNDMLKENVKFDCASKTQIQAVLELGSNIKNVIYSNPIKDQSDLRWAEKIGVKYTTADSIDQLIKIKKYAPSLQILWRIAIKQEEKDALATQFSGKFGDDLQNQTKVHERMIQISNLGINLKGIHFHCGSGHHGSSAFGRAVTLARFCLQTGRKYGHKMDLLDIGGGFPNGQLPQKTIQDLKLTKNDPLGYQIIAEPGRHFSGFSCHLLTRVIGKRLKNGKTCYHLNDSLYHSFNCNVMDGVSFQNQQNQFYSSILSDKKQVSHIFQTQNATLFGMTCDGMDIITKNIPVPKDLVVGDWLCIGGMGAYTYGCRSNFNGMKSTQNVVIWNSQVTKEYSEKPQKKISFESI